MAKVAASRSAAYVRQPDPAHRALLLYGPDPALLRTKRDALLTHVLGGTDDPFRLVRLQGEAVRRDPASLADECAAISFGGGERVVVLEQAGDALAGAAGEALDVLDGGTLLIALADALPAGSKLRKLFEGSPRAMALPFYPAEGAALVDAVAARIGELGAASPGPAGREALAAICEGMPYGEAMRFAEILALAVEPGEAPEAEDVLALAPPSAEADFDAAIAAVTGGAPRRIPSLLDRVEAEGRGLAGFLRVLAQHLARLHRAQALMETDGLDPAGAMGKLRPPVFWKMRDRFAAELRSWPRAMVETATAEIAALESELRSGRTRPERALIERTLMRIAMRAPGPGR